MVIDLKISERIELWKLLPEQGNITTVKAVRLFREAIGLTSDIEEGGVTQNGDQLNWPVDYPRSFDVPPAIYKIVTDALQALEAQSKLTEAQIGVWDKFVEMSEPAPAE